LAVRLATMVIPSEELEEMGAFLASVGDEIEREDFEHHFESDTQFHELIVRHCGNEVLQQVLGTLTDRIYRVRVFSRNQAGYHMKQSFRDHCRILDAITERDAAKAERLMAEHMRTAGKRIADLV